MRVLVHIEEGQIQGGSRWAPGLTAKCGRCSITVSSYGTGPNSARRNLALLREGCPLGESNFYVAKNPETQVPMAEKAAEALDRIYGATQMKARS